MFQKATVLMRITTVFERSRVMFSFLKSIPDSAHLARRNSIAGLEQYGSISAATKTPAILSGGRQIARVPP
jgi:hypothetical protein